MSARELALLVVFICCLAAEGQAQEQISIQSEALLPTIVSITAYDKDEKVTGQGHGFFINAKGEILTNRQVLRDAARAEVTTSNNHRHPVALVTAEDESSGIIKVSAGNLQGEIPFMSMSNASPKEKETLFIVNKEGRTKLAVGIDLLRIEIPTVGEFLKVVAPLSLSASGSPVVDPAGRVIGLIIVENIGGEPTALAVPRARISNLATASGSQKTFAQWAEGNTSEWLATAPGLYYKGIVLQATAGCEKSLPTLKAAQEEDADNAQIFLLVGRCQSLLGHLQDAIEAYRRAVRIKPDFAEAHSELGNAYIAAFGGLGDEAIRAALEEYQKAVEIKPDFIEVHINLSAVYRKLGLIDEEIRTYQRIIELKPGLADAHVNLGAAYMRAGNVQGEINEYQAALKINPVLIEAIYNLGNAYLRSGQAEKSLQQYKEVLRLNPTFTLAHMGLGEAYLRLNRDSQATEEYRKAIELEPASATAHLNLGASYMFTKKHSKAVKSFKKVLVLKPGSREASVNLAIAYQKLKQPEKAREVLTQMANTGSGMTESLNSTGPSFLGFASPLVSAFSQVEQTNRALFLTTPQPAVTRVAADEQQPLERLFTAAWFTQAAASPTVNDYAGAAESFLREGNTYLLKFALQGSPFDQPARGGGAASGELQAPPSESLKPGTEMEVAYYSDGLEPKRGTARILTPVQGETSFAAFTVSPTRSDLKGVPVWIELSLKGLAFYTGTLTPTVVPQTGDAPREPELAPASTPAHKTTEGSTLNAQSRVKYVELRQHDVSIIITPDGDEPFDIHIDWKGHDRQSYKTGVTPEGLGELLDGFRAGLKELIDEASQHRKEDGSNEREIDGTHMHPHIRQFLVWRLAKLGHRLYDGLFTDSQLRQRLAEIKTFAQQNPGTVLRIQIKNQKSSTRMLLPFGMLYDDPDFTENSEDSTEAKAANFWDSRYQLEFDEIKAIYKKGTLCGDGPIRVAAAMDTGDPAGERQLSAEEWRNEVEAQRRTLERLKEEGKISLNLARNENDFLEIFRGKPSPLDIIYYYGHTNNTPSPSFSLTNSSRDISHIKDAAKDKEKGLRPLQDNPFIFLNSCKGLAFSGRSQNTFLNLMNDLKVSGFIGTETSVRIPYAAVIGQEFFKRIMSGKHSIPVVQALREMKHETLAADSGNPLIMLYSIYADPSVHTCASK